MNIDSTKNSIAPLLLVGTTLLTSLSSPLYSNTVPIPEENYRFINNSDGISYTKLENHFKFETTKLNENVSEPIIKAQLFQKMKIKINMPKPLEFKSFEDEEGFI